MRVCVSVCLGTHLYLGFRFTHNPEHKHTHTRVHTIMQSAYWHKKRNKNEDVYLKDMNAENLFPLRKF